MRTSCHGADVGSERVRWDRSFRETPSAAHNQSAGQIPRCFAMKENFTSIPSRSRPRLS